MALELYAFQCRVLPDGYAWQETSTGSDRHPLRLLVEEPPGWPPTARMYEPLVEYPGLFRVLASTRPAPEAILAFANRFGLLGCREVFDVAELEKPPRKGQFIDVQGERLEAWIGHIHALRRLVGLWDLCMAGDAGALAELIHWGGTFDAPEVWYRCGVGQQVDPELGPLPPVNELIASPTYHPERLERFRPPDRFAPSWAYLEQEINKRLGDLPVRLVWVAAEGRLRRRIAPPNLITALWLQFAEAIDAGRQYRACKACGLWFELSPELARTSRHFCSAACRNRSYRERQVKAREMHAKGRDVKEIAQELGSDARTVRSWIRRTNK